MARFFLAARQPHHLKDAPGGPALSDRGRRHACGGARSSSPSAARAAIRASCRRCRPGWTSRTATARTISDAGTGTGPGRRPTNSRSRCGRSSSPTTSLTTTTSRPSCACRSRCCRPTSAARSRPTRSPATSGTTSLRQSYKELPSVGTVKLRHPLTGAEYDYALPGGGRGYTRPARSSALGRRRRSCRTTASAVQSEPVGRGTDARLPGLDRTDAVAGTARARTSSSANNDGPGVGSIDRTTAESYIWVPAGYIPDNLAACSGSGSGCSRSCSATAMSDWPDSRRDAGQSAGKRRSDGRRPPGRPRAARPRQEAGQSARAGASAT